MFLLRLLALCACGQLATTADASTLSKDIRAASDQSLLWGPYRPNVYFGMRPRLPKSLITSLIWSKVDDYAQAQDNFRYTCEQNEGMRGYGWEEYDVRTGGRETIHDAGNNIDLTIDFVKVPGGSHGGSWGARIHGKPANTRQATTVVFVAALDGSGSLGPVTDGEPTGYPDDVKLAGNTPNLGDFTLDITRGPASNAHPQGTHPSHFEKPLDQTRVMSVPVESEELWMSKPILFAHLREQILETLKKYGQANVPAAPQLYTIPQAPNKDTNVHVIQKTFRGEFEFDVLFSSGSAMEPLTSSDLRSHIDNMSASFNERFKQIFAPLPPFNSAKYTKFAKSMLSNLAGGIGYFHGDELVDRSYAPEYAEDDEGFWEVTAEARARASPQLEGPHELFASTPSRPFFPRGFLWDEGFHLLPVMEWDLDLALQITQSWFNLMDDDGWIAREQILGSEARSKVPPDFQVQYPHYANPPTLFIVLERFVEKLQKALVSDDLRDTSIDLRSMHLKNPALGLDYLRALYPLLKRQHSWFRATQWGDIKGYDREAYSTHEGYRWRGRTPQHILTSGLDDYPRAQPPHPGELHVDLLGWMGLMTRALKNVARVLGEEEDVAAFSAQETAIAHNVDDLHWDDEARAYCDATIDEYEEHVLVCHKGYVSLMPFVTGLIPRDSPKLAYVLDLLSDPRELWSRFGIRSLSESDEFYGTDENYWRSPIWMNINYMILNSLLDVAQAPGPHQQRATELYSELRKNLVENVYREWKRTGFAWEQYNPEDGHGQRTQHFTGWTSLVVNIMAMPDLGAGVARDEL